MRKKGVFLVSMMMLMILTACGLNENREDAEAQTGHVVSEAAKAPDIYEYEPDIVRYGEVSKAFSIRKDVERTQTDYAIYYFETAISEQERQACITATDRVLACIDSARQKPEIAVLTDESFDSVALSGNRLYTSIRSWDSTEYLAGVLLAGYSEWGNYGLAYGYANYLCKQASANDAEAGLGYLDVNGFLPMSSPELYDLNLLCFDERFASLEDIEAAKNNACLFVDEYLSAHSEAEFLELLSDSGSVERVGQANEVLKAFYTENGVDCSLTEIRYRYGGVTFDYMAACEYACFYLDKDWQDMGWDINSKISENFLHENYAEVKTFFECNARQMGQYQEFFDFDSYNNDLTVIITNNVIEFEKGIYSGFYYGEIHTIYLAAATSLTHEYVHSVMWGHFDFGSFWKREGCAEYFSLKYNDYLYGITDWYYKRAETEIWLQEFLESLGRPLDLSTDYRTIKHILTYIREETNPIWSYDAAHSFVSYLVDQYGEREVLAYIGSDHEYNAEWGKSYEELVQDWNAYLNENYAWYGIE